MLVGLEGEIATYRQETIELINDIAKAFFEEDEATKEDRKRLSDIAQDLREMFFMLVVIGEFNAGKSTFINALLGDKMLDMGITPTTEYIEMICHSDTPQRKPEVREDGVRVWGHPNTGAFGVAIVDTPGTGSVFLKHEKTAKSFLHRSDLVVFLLNAKQAFAETERMYLELVQSYGKKIILVINQVDLLQPTERQEVRRFVENMAKEKLNIEPLIFEISAKDALNSLDGDAGGMGAIKAHLRGVYLEAPPAKQKLLSELETVERVLKVRLGRAKENTTLVGSNMGRVRTIEDEIDSQSSGLEARLASITKTISTTLEGIRQRGTRFIDDNLRVRLYGGAPSKEQLEREFQEVVIGRTQRDINEMATNYVSNVIDQSRHYWNSVIERLNKLQDLLEKQKEGFDAGIYAEQRQNLEEAIRVAEEELQTNMSGDVLSQLKAQFDENIGTFQRYGLATFGGLLTMLIAIATPGGLAAFPLVLPALLLGAAVSVVAGVPAVRAYRRAITDTHNEFNQRIDTLIKSYKDTLDEVTRKERHRLTQYGKQQLIPVFSQLETLAKRYQEQEDSLTALQRQLEALRKRVQSLS